MPAGQPSGSVLAAVDAAFSLLAGPPDPVGLDLSSWAGAGLPEGFRTLRQWRDWMLGQRRAYAARDLIWRELLARARRHPQWMTAAIGMALPGLVRAAGRLAHGFRGDPRDIDAEMVAAFMIAAKQVDLDLPFLYDRLRRQAIRAGQAVRNRDKPELLVADIERLGGTAPRLPYGHPDLILARAVSAGVIDARDADLIAVTRLERVAVEALAERDGIEAGALRMRRLRAERALVDALAEGLLSSVGSTERDWGIAPLAASRAAARPARAR